MGHLEKFGGKSGHALRARRRDADKLARKERRAEEKKNSSLETNILPLQPKKNEVVIVELRPAGPYVKIIDQSENSSH